MANWKYANVLRVSADRRQIWQFTANGDQFTPEQELAGPTSERVPSHIGGSGLTGIFRKKLNIAWLPAEKVFLRALQLPAADFAETLSMVELQMEKLSPLPVAQIAWTLEVLPRSEGSDLQTVIVVIVPYSSVEQFLGELEGQGYLPERIELPILDQLLATRFQGDGVWVFPGEKQEDPCLIAWYYGNTLQNVTLLSGISTPEQAARFKEQLSQIAWSGELEGWLTGTPQWHLVADAPTAAVWQPILCEISGDSVELTPPLPAAQLAALSARRAAHSPAASLLPAEYGTRYRQQNIDRLWMRGLGALLVLYMIGLIIYSIGVLFVQYQQHQMEAKVHSIEAAYKNVVQLEQRVGLLQEQANLKYGALDCWKYASDLLPEGVTLTSFNFAKGRTMTLFGTVLQDKRSKLSDYNEALQGVLINGKPLQVDAPTYHTPRSDKNGQQVIEWSFVCRIQVEEPK